MQALQCYKLLKRKVESKLDDPKILKFYMDFKFEYNKNHVYYNLVSVLLQRKCRDHKWHPRSDNSSLSL